MKKLLSPLTSVGMFLVTAAPALAAVGDLNEGAEGSIKIPRASNVMIDNLGTLIGSILGLILIIASILAFLYLILGDRKSVV